MQAPNYTIKDLVFWGGMMGGIIVTVTLMRPLGYHHIVNLLCGGGVGAALGYGGLFLYEMVTGSNRDDDGFE